MTVTVRIEGLKECVEGLQELKKATATNVQKRALTQAGKPILEDAQQKAPVRTGLLREDIIISSKLSPRQRAENDKKSKVEMYIGPPSMPRAIVAEFGSAKQQPKPFMRPAWDSNKGTAFLTIKEILAAEIEKARQRAAAKTARLAARG